MSPNGHIPEPDFGKSAWSSFSNSKRTLAGAWIWGRQMGAAYIRPNGLVFPESKCIGNSNRRSYYKPKLTQVGALNRKVDLEQPSLSLQ